MKPEAALINFTFLILDTYMCCYLFVRKVKQGKDVLLL
jgi:hypothetical protein